MGNTWIILLLTGIGIAGVMAFLYGASKHLLYNRDIHELAIQSHALRSNQIRRLAMLRGSEAWDSADLILDPSIARAVRDLTGGHSINVDIADENGEFARAA